MLTMQTQPNGWSCLPTAFAIATGINVTRLILMIGHDGSKILYPEFDDPHKRQAFHPQELLIVCYEYGFMVMRLDMEVYHGPLGTGPSHVLQLPQNVLNKMLFENNCVLVGTTPSGKRHAVAWCSSRELILDPNGTVYSLDKFNIETLFVIKNEI